jgi:hypothetical protein
MKRYQKINKKVLAVSTQGESALGSILLSFGEVPAQLLAPIQTPNRDALLQLARQGSYDALSQAVQLLPFIYQRQEVLLAAAVIAVVDNNDFDFIDDHVAPYEDDNVGRDPYGQGGFSDKVRDACVLAMIERGDTERGLDLFFTVFICRRPVTSHIVATLLRQQKIQTAINFWLKNEAARSRGADESIRIMSGIGSALLSVYPNAEERDAFIRQQIPDIQEGLFCLLSQALATQRRWKEAFLIVSDSTKIANRQETDVSFRNKQYNAKAYLLTAMARQGNSDHVCAALFLAGDILGISQVKHLLGREAILFKTEYTGLILKGIYGERQGQELLEIINESFRISHEQGDW